MKVLTDLPHGSRVYATAIATNHAGLTSVFYSEPLVLDHTPPILTNMSVGVSTLKRASGTDKANVSLQATWYANDVESDVKYCYCKIGKNMERSYIYFNNLITNQLIFDTLECSFAQHKHRF